MINARPQIYEGGLARKARDGDGLMAFLDPGVISADSNQTITVAQLAGGLILRTGATASRTDTTPTAAAILASVPDMDIGESFTIIVSSQVAFTNVIAGGVGVTASGNLTVPANSFKLFMFTKTSATAMTLIGL